MKARKSGALGAKSWRICAPSVLIAPRERDVFIIGSRAVAQKAKGRESTNTPQSGAPLPTGAAL